MPPRKPLKDLTAPDLVARWRALVNDHVMIGRDSHLIKEKLQTLTPVQILLGFYSYQKSAYSSSETITIPYFLSLEEDWLEQDEERAEIELARCISGKTPAAYWRYRDLLDEQTAEANSALAEAWKELMVWSGRILG